MKKYLFIALLLSLVISCNSDEGSDNNPEVFDNFDRRTILENIADNIIIPTLQDFSSKMEVLTEKGQDFVSNPNQTSLDDIRSAWYEAYKTWQYVEMFNLGKAEELQYSSYINIYPLTVTDVENNISNGNYDLNSVDNQDAQGFPALDYLLYGKGANDTEILETYISTNKDASGYKQYLTDVLAQMTDLTTLVLSDWTSSYRDTFVSNSGNTTTSSLNELANDFVFYYEKGLRTNKVGIPAGVFSANPLADRVEALYREDISKELLLLSLSAIQDVFSGKHYSSNEEGSSFDTYLTYLDRDDIVSNLNNQWNTARTQINTMSNSLYHQVLKDNSKMTDSYNELQKAAVVLKVDMLQAFNISVDYVDADGD